MTLNFAPSPSRLNSAHRMQAFVSRHLLRKPTTLHRAPLGLRSVSTQGQPSSEPRTASFGFRTVPEEAKEGMVRDVFDSVAAKYDLMNDASSLGVHRLWKDEFVASLRPGRRGPQKCIDVAGGTGDIALRILDFAREKYACRDSTVDVVDINSQMLKEGVKRFKKTMYYNSKSLPCTPVVRRLILHLSTPNLLYRRQCARAVSRTIS